ncbi:DEAD/DEAH box helicase [uncultured Methanosphaera sp.]|uniref:DEAD/DEAH box helicase n=1 Tax=uncultured Methanosphaera sp. TaxID=262501 RepID=UPI00280425D2|nr:DEAD/DEAH box helicase [uncultured Methanosphaera sp.]
MTTKLIQNDIKENQKVITTIQKQLNNCKEFKISVAFITESGVTPLLQTLKKLEEKEIPGKIITSDYLYFSQPKALRKLNQFKNIDVKLYSVDEKEYGFHTKGYIFKKEDENYNIIVGSSNLTHKALTTNKEWNILSENDTQLTDEILQTFDEYWNESIPLEDCINEYEKAYSENQIENEKTWKSKPDFKPNQVQKDFIEKLEHVAIQEKQKRGLFISATGTGKTIASAFGIRKLNPKKVLFLVHREQIAKQAMKSYQKIFKDKTIGLISGNHKDYYADFIFSTTQMMSKPQIHEKYDPSEFDVIVIDEVHHAGAMSYQRIMNYFNPGFYLGMTATPERSDEYDIYELFDHNIIHEIRLKDAMENDLLCNFNYFGVSDNAVDINDTSDKRVDHIIENIEYYGYNGKRVKGLVFCNTIKNSQILSEKFNQRGYNTVALSGSNTQAEREEYVKRLISDTTNDPIDYIFTVDIFNEGVDIREINQIIMLRETKSSIIFTQQLGRGLRKADNKEFVVVLDFIGNYKTNFMIPIALSGDLSYNKDKIRNFMYNSNNMIIGSSTVNFDKISKERIYTSIDKARFNINFFRNEYVNLKNKIGHIPRFSDFYTYNQLDPELIIKYIKGSSHPKTYPTMLERLDCDYVNNFSELELEYLEFLTLNVFNSKRIHELLILGDVIQNNTLEIDVLADYIDKNYNFLDCETTMISAIRKLDKSYFKPPEQKKFHDIEFITQKDNIISIHPKFKSMLNENKYFYNEVIDMINLGVKYFNDNTEGIYYDDFNFELYHKYSKWDMACLINWPERDPIYGYVIKENPLNNKIVCPICITYDHYDHVNEFYDKQTISWVTTTPRTFQSKDIKNIINYEKQNIEFLLFLKKNNDDGREFYYMGPVTPHNPHEGTLTNTKGDVKPTVYFDLKLKYPVRDDIYDYITS